MNPGLTRAVPCFSTLPKLLPKTRHASLAKFSRSVSSPPASSLKPRIPLFLKSPTYSATLSDLHKWLDWANDLSSSRAENSNNELDADLLRRELNWLLEDAVENHHSQIGIQNKENLVNLRVDLEELYLLWKQRIEERRPFQYIVGCEHWRDLVLSVQEGVLIPRPETELIVDLAAEVISGSEELREGIWADLGTGSGAIAIGIARILGSGGRVFATDLSPVAVTVATYNAERYELQDKIEIKQGSWFEPLKDFKGELAGIVSNPPYIPSNDISGLQAEVGKHEPRLALDGGVNGLVYLVHICNEAASMLKPNGFFAFETNGEKHCKFLVDYINKEFQESFHDVKIVSDFAGIQRFVTGIR